MTRALPVIRSTVNVAGRDVKEYRFQHWDTENDSKLVWDYGANDLLSADYAEEVPGSLERARSELASQLETRLGN